MKNKTIIYDHETKSLYRYSIDQNNRKLNVEEAKPLSNDPQWTPVTKQNIKEDFVGTIVNKNGSLQNGTSFIHVNKTQNLVTSKSTTKRDNVQEFDFARNGKFINYRSSSSNDPNIPKDDLNQRNLPAAPAEKIKHFVQDDAEKNASNLENNSNESTPTSPLKPLSPLDKKDPGVDLHTIHDFAKENPNSFIPNPVSSPMAYGGYGNNTSTRSGYGSYTQTVTQPPKSKEDAEENNSSKNATEENKKPNYTKKFIFAASAAAILTILIGGSLGGLSAGGIIAAFALLLVAAVIDHFLQKDNKKEEKKDEKKSELSILDKGLLFTGAVVSFCMALGAIPLAIGIGILCLCAAVKIISSVFSSKKVNRKEEPGKNLFKNAALLLGGILGIVGTLMLFSLLGPTVGALCLVGFALVACVALCRQFNLHKIFMHMHSPNASGDIPRKPKLPKEPKQPIPGKNESDDHFAKREEKYSQAKEKYDTAMNKYVEAKAKYDIKVEALKQKSLEVKAKYDKAKAKYANAEKELSQNPSNEKTIARHQEAKMEYEKASKELDKAIFVSHKDDPVAKEYGVHGEMQKIKENFQKTTKNFSDACTEKVEKIKAIPNNGMSAIERGVNNWVHCVTGRDMKGVKTVPQPPSNEDNDVTIEKAFS